MTFTSMMIVLLVCEDLLFTGGLNPEEQETCDMIHDAIKYEVAANGNFNQYIEWRVDNDPVVRQYMKELEE
jgi:hypothetical protein